MTTTLRQARSTGFALTIALLGSACERGAAPGRGGATTARGDDAIEVVVPTAPATLDPRFATDAVGMRVTRLVHAGLVRLDGATLEPTPYVAASWAWQGDRVLDVEMRAGLRFHSGAALEAVDVCATLEALADPKLGSPHRAVVAAIERCEPRGPTALRVRLREPRATLLTDLEVPVLRRDEAASAPRPGGGLDGLGPFRVDEASEGATRLASAGFGPLPRPAHDVVIRVVRDENARAVRLLAGRVDVAPNAVSPASLSALEAQGVRVRAVPGANLTYLLVHNGRPGLDDAAARRALGMAIDRDALVRTLLGGKATPAATFLPPSSWAFHAPPNPPRFDRAAAAEALARAGVRTLSLMTSTDRQRQTMGRAIAQMLGDVGVAVDVVPLDLGVMLQRLSAGDFELAVLQIPEITEPNVLRWFFHSSAIPTRAGGAGANRARFASAEVDRLLDEASVLPGREERRVRYEQALRAMEREAPVVPLFHEDQVVALSGRAAAFEPTPDGRWLGLARLP